MFTLHIGIGLMRNVNILLALKLLYITEYRNKLHWLPHSPSIKDCLYLIRFILRCLYTCIEDGNRFMFSTEINKMNETESWHCKIQNWIGPLHTACWLKLSL
jgi:hypothetical protein